MPGQSTRRRVALRDRATVQGAGPKRSRQRLLQEGQQRMDVPADVGRIHLEQHAQEVHRQVVPQIDQAEQQAVGDVQLEVSTSPDATPPSLPEEGRPVRADPQRFELIGQEGKFRRVQAAE